MKLMFSALLCATLVETAHAGALLGISKQNGTHLLVRIDSSTGQVEILRLLGFEDVLAFTGMTFDSNRQKYAAVAQYTNNISQIIWIDTRHGPIGEPIELFSNYFAGLEYWSAAQKLVMAHGANGVSNTFVGYNQLYQVASVNNPGISGLDMDTLFLDGQDNLFQLDVSNPFGGSPLHRVDNFWSAPTFVPVGSSAIYTGAESDCAYDSVNDRVYITRGTSLAYYNLGMTAITNVGNYNNGHNIKALAYGPLPQVITVRLRLDDMIASFAPGVSRTVDWKIKQGTTTFASGSVTTTSAYFEYEVILPEPLYGNFVWFWDTGSSLRSGSLYFMQGIDFSVGTNLRNGDPDHSGEVDGADIDLVVLNFGNTFPGSGDVDADLDGTGEVDAKDIDIVIANFGIWDD